MELRKRENKTHPLKAISLKGNAIPDWSCDFLKTCIGMSQ
jgi:hypothetical protein